MVLPSLACAVGVVDGTKRLMNEAESNCGGPAARSASAVSACRRGRGRLVGMSTEL